MKSATQLVEGQAVMPAPCSAFPVHVLGGRMRIAGSDSEPEETQPPPEEVGK